VERPDIEVGLVRHGIEDAGRIGRVVAADIEEVADVAFLEDFQNSAAVRRIGLVPARAERRRW
jgi:hypothetical protein